MFFARYNRIISLTFIVVIVISLGVFFWQINSQYKYEISLIQDHFEEEVISLDEILKTNTDYIEALRIRANSFYEVSKEDTDHSQLFNSLQYNPQEDIYSLDNIPFPYKSQLVGNLTGKGSLQGRSPEFYREIEMALALNPLLNIALHIIPNDVWAFYISRNNFINAYPWRDSQIASLSQDFYNYEFYTLGLPENNPQGELFWTEIYQDPVSDRLLVTSGAPVYEGEEFRGTVDLDVDLAIFNQILTKFNYKIGDSFLINQHQQIIAPQNQDSAIQLIQNTLPQALQEEVSSLLESQEKEVQSIGAYLFFHRNLEQSPWKLIFFSKKSAIMIPIISKNMLVLGILYSSLILMLLIANYLIKREFIDPTRQLINHIEAESKNLHPEVPKIPTCWNPWFQTITKTFEENRKITAELIQREKMSSLGQLVAGVAHEINNPVNFIYGNLSHAKEYTDDLIELAKVYQLNYPYPKPAVKNKIEEIDLEFLLEDLPKIFESMQVGTKRIRQIVLSLQSFSRQDQVKLKAVDIHEGIDNTLMILETRLKPQGSFPGIKIIKEYSQLPLTECFSGQLNQVFMNLICNAIDALEETHQDCHKITIQTSYEENSHILVTIADNGPGLTEEIKQHLFEPFFTTKPVGKGTGLGLSISFQIMEKLGGKLDYHSVLGEGTKFFIEIPMQCQLIEH